MNYGVASGVLGGTPADINALIQKSVSRDPWWYYYTLKLAAGTAFLPQWQLFNASVGQSDPNPLVGGAATQTLTKVETNMPSACSSGFAAPRDLIMDGMGFYFRASGCGNTGDGVGTFASVSDMLAFCQYTYFEFKIIDKVFAEGMLELKPSGLGFNGMTTVGSQQVFTLGIANPHATVKSGIQYAKYLAPLLPWSVTIYAPSNAGPGGLAASLLAQGSGGGHGLWLVSYLSGLTDRAIQ
jgi:hypothetical protein